MKIIPRPLYMERLQALRGTPDIKIVTGIRRSGKSLLLLQYAERLRKEEPDVNIVQIDFTDLDSEPLKDYHALHDYVVARYRSGCGNVLMIDEVQMCPHFELAVNSLHRRQLYDIYITGSNAFLLSSDLATLFTGRHIDIHVLPFSFREYTDYYVPTGDIQQPFDRYTVAGGLAGSYLYKEEADRVRYLADVYETIVTRDLADKYSIADMPALTRVCDFLMDNIGNTVSTRAICDALAGPQASKHHATVAKYIKYMCDAFVFYKVRRYDIRGKKYLATQEKYYLSDTGLRYALLGLRNMDWGRVYENIVFLELLRRGYTIYIGKLYQKEVDFVAIRGGEKLYIQVSDDISSPDTLTRELDPLRRIRDSYQKLLLARTRHADYDVEGIVIADLAHWLSRP